MIDYNDAQAQFKRFKTRLTRAINTKNPTAILAEVKYFRDKWPATYPYPDDWSRWQRAADDAFFALQRAGIPCEQVVL